MPDTLLITGGSGYLGTRLARQASDWWRVVASYFSHPAAVAGCEFIRLDLRDPLTVAAHVAQERPRAIIHTASDMRSPEAMQAVIVDGTRNIASAAVRVGARLIHLSSDMVFDGEQGPYREADQPQPITPYGRAKAEAERIVAECCSDALIVRTSLIYGLDPPDPRTLWVIDSLRHAVPITLFTDEVRCPVWVEQLAAGILELLDAGSTGVWHLAGPQSLSRYEFGERLARACGLEPGGLIAGLRRDSGLVRPRDLTLDVGKAQACLQAPLWGVDQVLAHRRSAPPRG